MEFKKINLEDEPIKEQETKPALVKETKAPTEAPGKAPEGRNIINEVADELKTEIKNTDQFKSDALRLYNEEVRVQAETKALEIATEQQKNDYARYILEQQKTRLANRMKLEKKIDKEAAKAEAMQKKIQNAKDRYGYLTPLLDEEGRPVIDKETGKIVVDLKKFTPNKCSNRFKELEFNYRNMSQSARKIIGTSAKTALIIAAVALGGYILWKFGGWFLPFIAKITQ